jgi:hypothetical protein
VNEAYRLEVAKWASVRVREGLQAVARMAIQDTAEVVDELTPVDVGFLVASWQPGIGAPLLEEPEGLGRGYAASKVTVTLTDMKLGEMFYYTNNAVYARRINYGFVGEDSLGRHYNQRGVHMLETAIARWPTAVEVAAQKVMAAS